MQSRILSVTVPTWNRKKLLEELLSELLDQILSDKLESKIELLISNNGSEDETDEFVLSLKAKHGFITYNNNGINKGARYNVLKCMEIANAEYLILFGDDDRPQKGILKKIIDYLEINPRTGSLYDSHLFRRNPFGDSIVTLPQLLENFYYYLGNAGLFIVKSKYVKDVLKKHPYDFFSPTWPQTQILILASEQNLNDEIRICDLNVLSPGMHEHVMIYSSYYLWRTTYLDLVTAIESIRDEVNTETYLSAKSYYTKTVRQLFFNILQCGVFLDSREIRYKTSKSIFQNLNRFSFSEKTYLTIAAIALIFPTFFSRIFSNLFIFITRGKLGIKKKNYFVRKEREKRRKKLELASKDVREFDFVNV
jgi:glycosyltransferase involved in cell wall biosynthesis